MIPGKIERKKFIPDSPELLKAVLERLEGKAVILDIQKQRKTRTDPMNKYYWGIVISYISDTIGHTPKETHELMKHKFLGYKVVSIAGEKYPLLNSSRELSTDEFSKYLRDIIFWAGEFLQITIPEAK